MRVHLHTDNFWFSGSETTLLLLADELFADPDVDVTFTYRDWPEYSTGLRAQLPGHVRAEPVVLADPADLKRRLTGDSRSPLARAVRGLISALPTKPLYTAIDVVRLARTYRRMGLDVLHVNNGGLPGAVSCNAAAIAGRLARVPAIVYVVNNIAYGYGGPFRWADWPVDRLVVRSVHRFVTGSSAAGDALKAVLHLPDGSHQVIPNGVRRKEPSQPVAAVREQWNVPDGALVLAQVARLEPRKGHRFLFTAIARLRADLRDRVVLLVAGDGPERAALEAAARADGVADHVRFLGPHPDPWSLYRAADLVVLPSIGNEDLPIVIIEAMASERAVVASRVAGVPSQIVEGTTGLIVEPGDAAALADAITGLLDDPDRRALMGDAGRRRYEQTYTPERVVGQYRDLYDELLAGRPR